MAKPLIINVGDAYGKLTIVSEVDQTGNGRRFLCKCDCGQEKEVNLSKLRSGNTKSCGCFQLESRGRANITHGMTGSRLYNIWYGMKDRCTNPNSSTFNYYGGRGIRFSDEWKNFAPFMEWALSNGYQDDLTLERKDVDKNYDPGNCEWVSMRVQNLNKRNTLLVEYKGETKPLKTWCKELGKDYLRVWKRLNRGWSTSDAFEVKCGGSARNKSS